MNLTEINMPDALVVLLLGIGFGFIAGCVMTAAWLKGR